MANTQTQAATAQAAEQATAQETVQQTNDAQANEAGRTFTQADVDRMIADRLSRERRQHEKDIENARVEARTEAERLAQMTAEQRAQHEREQAETAARQREEQLNAKEAELNRRELRYQTIETLREKQLPTELVDLVDCSSADAVSKSIKTLEDVFRDAVQRGVESRLKTSGLTMPSKSGQKPDYARMSDAEYYASTYKKK